MPDACGDSFSRVLKTTHLIRETSSYQKLYWKRSDTLSRNESNNFCTHCNRWGTLTNNRSTNKTVVKQGLRTLARKAHDFIRLDLRVNGQENLDSHKVNDKWNRISCNLNYFGFQIYRNSAAYPTLSRKYLFLIPPTFKATYSKFQV